MEMVNDVVETAIEATTPADAPVATETVSDTLAPEGTSPAADTIAAQSVDPLLAAPATPAYTPDFKVKIKGKEHEIDEMFRGLIKDADSEKKVKEIFEKAYGIESVKADRQAIKQEHEGFRSAVIPFLQTYDQFTQLRDQGNLGAAFKVANISDEQVFEYALQKLQMDQNPVMAKTFQAQQESSIKELELQRKVAMYEQRDTVTAEQSFANELEQSMEANASLVNQINQKFGSEEFFRDEVVQYGLLQMRKGVQVSPSEATAAVVNKYKQFFPSNSLQTAPAAASVASAAPTAPARPSTMPNVGNTNVSPVAKKVRSMEDLFAAQKESQLG